MHTHCALMHVKYRDTQPLVFHWLRQMPYGLLYSQQRRRALGVSAVWQYTRDQLWHSDTDPSVSHTLAPNTSLCVCVCGWYRISLCHKHNSRFIHTVGQGHTKLSQTMHVVFTTYMYNMQESCGKMKPWHNRNPFYSSYRAPNTCGSVFDHFLL